MLALQQPGVISPLHAQNSINIPNLLYIYKILQNLLQYIHICEILKAIFDKTSKIIHKKR
jgi:hypothetical protein